MFPLIPITPDPTLISIGPLNIGWYGIGYVVALAVLLLVTQTEAERRGIARTHVWNALLIVGVLALLGGRLYHVIDEFDLYRDNPISIFLPPYAGLGLYGGVAGAFIGIVIYTFWQKINLRLALDSVIAGTLFAQGIARWGNFFNQELYGPPTDAPWGIAIDCAHRIVQYPCSQFPEATTGFHPLFFYESALNILGGFIVLWLSRRYLHRLYPGDLAAFWGIWYGATRTILETFRTGWNWTIGGPGGIPTAQLVGIALMAIGVAWILYNHRPGSKAFAYPDPIVPAPPAPDPFADDDVFDDDDEFEDDVGEGVDEATTPEEVDDDGEEPAADEEEGPDEEDDEAPPLT